MTTDPREALERLTRWRDVGDGPDDYTAAGQRFAYDVITLLSLQEWRPISEAPRDRSELILGSHAGMYHPSQRRHWVRGYVDEQGGAWDADGYPVPATHFRAPPLPPAPTEDKP